MKKIVFMWSGVKHEGIITGQVPSSIQGQKTCISIQKMNDKDIPVGNTYTLYGKCEVGDCGPYKIISIN